MDEKLKAGYLEKMQGVVLFRYLDGKMLEEVLRLSEIVTLGAKTQIITEGEVDPHLYVVLNGSVTVSVREGSGKEVYISTIGGGDVFGEAGIFPKSKRTANVSSVTDSVLLKIHREKLIGFIKSRPSAGIKMLMIIIYSLLRKLREANQELAFERKDDIDQDDIDSFIDGMLGV